MNATTWEQPAAITKAELARQCLSDLFMPTSVPATTSTNQGEFAGIVQGRWEILGVHTRPTRMPADESHLLRLVSSKSGSKIADEDFLSVVVVAKQKKQHIARHRFREWMNVSADERKRQTQQMATLIEQVNAERDEGSKIFR